MPLLPKLDLPQVGPLFRLLHLRRPPRAEHRTRRVRGEIGGAEILRHPRYHLHFTPTSGSWVNQVERWFAEITNKRIRRGSFDSVRSLEKAIEEYLLYNNQYPKPFVWTADADLILGKIQRLCERISNSPKPSPPPQTSSTNV